MESSCDALRPSSLVCARPAQEPGQPETQEPGRQPWLSDERGNLWQARHHLRGSPFQGVRSVRRTESHQVRSCPSVTFELYPLHLAPQDKDGQFQPSPPKDLDKLYKQGPPQRVYIESAINALKQQTMCCGVYTLLGSEVRACERASQYAQLARFVASRCSRLRDTHAPTRARTPTNQVLLSLSHRHTTCSHKPVHALRTHTLLTLTLTGPHTHLLSPHRRRTASRFGSTRRRTCASCLQSSRATTTAGASATGRPSPPGSR